MIDTPTFSECAALRAYGVQHRRLADTCLQDPKTQYTDSMNRITFFLEMTKLATGVYGCPFERNITTNTNTFDFSGRGCDAGDVAMDCYHTITDAGYEAVADVQIAAGHVVVVKLTDTEPTDRKPRLF